MKKILCKGILLFAAASILQSCASSAVTNEAANQVDAGYQNASSLIGSIGNTGVAESYQNSSQTTKGVMLGGLTGAVVGSTTSSVGFVPGVVGGAILGGALGAYIDGYASTKDKLQNRNVKVIELGDQILLVLPSSRIFDGMTPTIRPAAYSTLNLVSQLISGYPNMMVKIATYTNASGPQRINQALSQQQAESIEKYLWRTGINTRLLYAQGFGGCKLVEKNSLDWDKSENYRIEITLEKLPV